MKPQFKVLIIAIILILLSIVFLRQSPVFASNNTPTPNTSYAPAAYGIPNIVAGYKIFAVLTSENTMCMLLGAKRLVLQSSQPEPDYPDTSSVTQELKERGIKDIDQWEIMIVGPGTNLEQFLAENEKWNADAKKNGCAKLGPMPEAVWP